MGCSKVQALTGEGKVVTGIVCSRGNKRKKRCAWCGAPADYLCDGVSVNKTCDAPMCARHRTSMGPDRDLCPDCSGPQQELVMIDFKKLAEESERKRREREANPGPLISVENAKTELRHRKIHTWHYVGRAMPLSPLYHGSSLGNPFRPGADGDGDLLTVLLKYKNWLWERMQESGSSQLRELEQILSYSLEPEGIALLCWCTTRAPGERAARPVCHAEIIRDAVAWLYKSRQPSVAMLRYRTLEQQLVALRAVHEGRESEGEEALVEQLTDAWYGLTVDEQAALRAEGPKTLIRGMESSDVG